MLMRIKIDWSWKFGSRQAEKKSSSCSLQWNWSEPESASKNFKEQNPTHQNSAWFSIENNETREFDTTKFRTEGPQNHPSIRILRRDRCS
jgi:hypothetical protein